MSRPKITDGFRRPGQIEAPQQPAEPVPAPAAGKPAAAPKPKNTKTIYVYAHPDAHKQLKLMAVQDDRDMSDIVLDAINEYFVSRGLPAIAKPEK